MADASKTGAWIDTKTDRLVYSQPEEGRQLVVPGGAVSPDTAATIKRYEDAAVEDVPVRPSKERATALRAPEKAVE